MKLISWNVNGIRAVLKKGALQKLLAEEQPDVLCLQETKAKRGQVEVDFEEYTEFWNSAERPGYSGTAVFIKNGVVSEEVKIDFDDDLRDDYGDLTKEGRVTCVDMGKFFAISVYVPNSKGDLSRLGIREDWDKELAAKLIKLQKKKPVIIAGDFNVANEEIDLANPKGNRGKHGFTDQERIGFKKILEEDLVDSFRKLHPKEVKYSWWSHWGNARERNVGWRIDYFLVSEVLVGKVRKADILDNFMGSDHAPVILELEI